MGFEFFSRHLSMLAFSGKGSGLLEEYPSLTAYIARGQARPACQRAFAAQLAVFKGNPAD